MPTTAHTMARLRIPDELRGLSCAVIEALGAFG
jgi:hypothetical protein